RVSLMRLSPSSVVFPVLFTLDERLKCSRTLDYAAGNGIISPRPHDTAVFGGTCSPLGLAAAPPPQTAACGMRFRTRALPGEPDGLQVRPPVAGGLCSPDTLDSARSYPGGSQCGPTILTP